MCSLGEGVRSRVGAENIRRKKLAGFHRAVRHIASPKKEQHEQGLRPGGKKFRGHGGKWKVEGPAETQEKSPRMPAAGTAGTESSAGIISYHPHSIEWRNSTITTICPSALSNALVVVVKHNASSPNQSTTRAASQFSTKHHDQHNQWNKQNQVSSASIKPI